MKDACNKPHAKENSRSVLSQKMREITFGQQSQSRDGKQKSAKKEIKTGVLHFDNVGCGSA